MQVSLLVQNFTTFLKIQCKFIGFKQFVQANEAIIHAILKVVNFWALNNYTNIISNKYGFGL
jgi:hypothetical protein